MKKAVGLLIIFPCLVVLAIIMAIVLIGTKEFEEFETEADEVYGI